jgi:predicted acetyltransferase
MTKDRPERHYLIKQSHKMARVHKAFATPAAAYKDALTFTIAHSNDATRISWFVLTTSRGLSVDDPVEPIVD